jgi:hypothetical protein
VVDENDIPLLVEHAHDDQWREVVLLTIGLAARPMRERLVERLLKRAETRKRIRSRLYLLAAACTQVAREEMRVDIRLRIEQGLAELVPLKSVEEVEAMAAAGVLAIPYLASRFEYSSDVAAACVRALLQIGTEAAFDVLLDNIRDNTSAVKDALIMGLRVVADKIAYARRFLSHIEDVSASPAMFELLRFLPHLTSLGLYDLLEVSDLTFVEWLSGLTSLSLSNLPQVSDFTFVERLPGLTSLSLSNLPQVSDLTFVERLPGLTFLSLSDLPQVSDLSFLERLGNLKSIAIGELSDQCVFPDSVLKRVRMRRL